jgi:protein-S-isoprenylcysteine O-methyltransferase
MDRRPPIGGGYSSQDARSRSNLAVQPAATQGNVSLKKAAVKVVSRTGPPTPARSPASTAPHPPSQVTVSKGKDADGYVTAHLSGHLLIVIQSPPSTPTKIFSPKEEKDIVESLKARIQLESPVSKNAKKDDDEDLDAMFARLMSRESTPKPQRKENVPTSSKPSVMLGNPKAEADKTEPESSKHVTITDQAAKENKKVAENKSTAYEVKSSSDTDKKSATPVAENKDVTGLVDASKEALEQEYLQKAYHFLVSLPATEGTIAHLVLTVAIKLRDSFGVGSSAALHEQQSKCVEAIATYLQSLPRNDGRVFEHDAIRKILQDNEGDLLRFCAKLVDHAVLSIDDLDEVVGLCTALAKVLSEEEKLVPPEDKKSVPVIAQPSAASIDPMDKLSSWPNREKREKGR